MKTVKYAIATGALGGLYALSMPAMAEVTGGVAATSEYMFRGIVSEGGAAVQGNLDWSHDSGVYAGLWASNAAAAGGNELDLIAGYSVDLSDMINLDMGGIYYVFTEDDDEQGFPDLDYWEIYLGLNIQNFSFYAYYTDDLFAVEDAIANVDGESIYLSADYSLPLNSVASLGFHIGTQIGDGADAFYDADGDGDAEYVDYGISLDIDMGNDWGANMAIIDTDLKDGDGFYGGGVGSDDEPKVVITFSKSFAVAE